MSSATPMFEVGAKVLGYVGLVATWRRMVPGQAIRSQREPMLTIQVCDSSEDGVYTPAASVTINSRAGLMALREAIDEALKEPSA